jgi:hypothetical protein
LPGKAGQCEVKDGDDADVWLNPGRADVNIGEVVADETLIVLAEAEVGAAEDADEVDEEGGVDFEAGLSATQLPLFSHV